MKLTKEDKMAYKLALLNAAEMIRGHIEIGLTDKDVDMPIDVYKKGCYRVHDLLIKKADSLIIIE